jgi:leucyl aminopeptidase
MATMKGDMAGAATVLAAIKAIAALKLPINVNAYCGLAENMVSGNCYKLGDILTSRCGKTVEVLNTDAEGRLVLADVLDVAKEHKPAAIVDIATLTGACVVALGMDVAGLMTNDSPLCERIKQAAHTTGERMWELPMFVEFGEQNGMFIVGHTLIWHSQIPGWVFEDDEDDHMMSRGTGVRR